MVDPMLPPLPVGDDVYGELPPIGSVEHQPEEHHQDPLIVRKGLGMGPGLQHNITFECPFPNEEWSSEGSVSGQQSCAGIPPKVDNSYNNSPVVIGACVCKQGFIRAKDGGGMGDCVLEHMCAQQAQCTNSDEVWKDCSEGALCQKTCAGKPRFCPTFACTKGLGACACKAGLVRNVVDGSCISEGQCLMCPFAKNVTWSLCASGTCQPSCSDQSPSCSPSCGSYGGCICLPGFVRAGDGGLEAECIAKAQCPPQSNN